MNITIIAGIFSGLARRAFGRRRAFWVAAAGVALYTLLVGASAAVVRAALMGFLYLWAQYLGRESSAPVSLGAAAIVMTACNPHALWDVGFQLSFAATLGLMLYTKPLAQSFERLVDCLTSAERVQKIVSLLSDALISTLAAQIVALPLLLHHFGQLSLITLASNTLILPIQPMVMIWGGAATLLALIAFPLGQVAAWVAWIPLTYTIEMVRLTAQVPHASVAVQAAPWMVVAYYATLGGLTWWLARPPERQRELWSQLSARLETKVLVAAGIILLVLAFFFWRDLPDGNLHVVFLDVGQGDAIFIQTPSGRQVLIDGGPSETQLLSQLGRQMPFWDRSLDVMVLTHPDSDHVTGLVAVLERFQVDMVIHRQLETDSETYDYWLELVEAGGAAVYLGQAGLHLTLDRGLEMRVLHPGAELWEGVNDNSVVTWLAYGQVSLLLPGDIEAAVEQQLVTAGEPLASTVLKVPHHGSCSSTSLAFLDAVAPEAAIISVGADNRLGHPCDEVLERLGLALSEVEGGLPVYRTDVHGAVEVISDGARVWVQGQR